MNAHADNSESSSPFTQTPGQARPPMPEKLNVSDIIHLTARLAQVLAEEVDLLSAMEIRKISELQQEKLSLTNALEGHRKMLVKYPHLKDGIASQERHELESIVKIFEDILAENHRRLLVAKEANFRIVDIISKAVRDACVSKVYDGRGSSGALGTASLSITLNQVA